MLVREYFQDDELCCHCGCGLMPSQEAVERLYALRILLRRELPISSAARCRKQNGVAGGKAGSIHLPPTVRIGASAEWGGGAFDILADKDLQIAIIAAALKCGFVGFGTANRYIHIDDAARPGGLTYWKYDV